MTPRVRRYIREAAARFDVPAAAICSNERSALPARWYLWRRLRSLGMSYPKIGEVTGHHHSTVMYAIAKGADSPAPKPKPKPAPAPPPISEGLAIVLANIAAMQAKHERELRQRY